MRPMGDGADRVAVALGSIVGEGTGVRVASAVAVSAGPVGRGVSVDGAIFAVGEGWSVLCGVAVGNA